MRLGVSLPSLDHSFGEIAEFARAAEQAGLDAVWNYEVFKNPFIMHALTAERTKSIDLCIGITSFLLRTPFAMANAALDVAKISGGRLKVGVGPGTPGLMDVYAGVDVDRPVARTREYLQVLKLALNHLATGEEATYEGQFQRFGAPATIWGARIDGNTPVPIYLGAVRPKMLQLAGEVADGIIGYLLDPDYIAAVVRPSLAAGAERAGRNPKDIDVVSYTICCCNNDRDLALRWARVQVGIYVAHPNNRMSAEAAGLHRETAEVLSTLEKHGPAALAEVTDDKLVRMFSISGTPEECRQQATVYEGSVDEICLHTPYVPPFTVEETTAAFEGIIAAFGREPSEPRALVLPASNRGTRA